MLTTPIEHLASLRVGTTAANFSFETRDGQRLRLSEAAQGRPMLLLFYDPDCDHCMQTIAELSGSLLLNGAVARATSSLWQSMQASTAVTVWYGSVPSTACPSRGRWVSTAVRSTHATSTNEP